MNSLRYKLSTTNDQLTSRSRCPANGATRIIKSDTGLKALKKVNQHLLKIALHTRKLDIDATEVISQKADVKWTYNKNPGYMPMVGHISEVGMVVACGFREGNQPPAKDNLAFIGMLLLLAKLI